LLLFLAFQFLAYSRAQIFKIIKITKVLGKLIIQLGKPLLSDILDLHLKGGILAGEILVTIVRWKGDPDLSFFTLTCTNKLGFEIGVETVTTYFQVKALGFTIRNRLTLSEGFEIKDRVVSLLNGTRLLKGFEIRVCLSTQLEFSVNFFLVDN